MAGVRLTGRLPAKVRQACYAVAFAALASAGSALTGSSIPNTVTFGIGLLGGAFFGLGLAKW
jgi:hypothetical protein